MHKTFIRIGALSAGLSVILGAFGAHALKAIVAEDALKTFHTGVEYQFYHSLAILLVGILMVAQPSKGLSRAGGLFLTGIIFFSGSLYVLTFLKATGDVGLKSIGLVTPIGGIFFIGGWLSLAFGLSNGTHKHGDKSS